MYIVDSNKGLVNLDLVETFFVKDDIASNPVGKRYSVYVRIGNNTYKVMIGATKQELREAVNHNWGINTDGAFGEDHMNSTILIEAVDRANKNLERFLREGE